MIKYNIYKEIDGIKTLIQTVTDVRKVTFISDETGDVKYSITKIDDRGESEEIESNTIIVLAKPEPLIIKNEGYNTFLIATSSKYSDLIEVYESNDNISWKLLYEGKNKKLPLHNDNTTYYKYRIKLEDNSSISNFSDVLQYDFSYLPELDLKVKQVDKYNFQLSWDNSYYNQYSIIINQKTYAIVDNSINNKIIPFTEQVVHISILANTGSKIKNSDIIFSAQPIPSKPTEFTAHAKNNKITLYWKSLQDTNYKIVVNDELLQENIINNTFSFIKPVGNYNIKLYAKNYTGESVEYAETNIVILDKPKPFIIENTVNSNNETQVTLKVTEQLPYNYYDIIIETSDYPDKYFKYFDTINNKYPNIIIPKKCIKKYFRICYYKDNSLSVPSDVVIYYKPKLLQPQLDYKHIGFNIFGLPTYRFTWTQSDNDMAYSLFKNGILMCKLDANTSWYELSAYNGDLVCVHNHKGYVNKESNIIHIKNKYEFSIYPPLDLRVNYIKGLETKLTWNFIKDKNYNTNLIVEHNSIEIINEILQNNEYQTFLEEGKLYDVKACSVDITTGEKSDYIGTSIQILEKPKPLDIKLGAKNIKLFITSALPLVDSYNVYRFDDILKDWVFETKLENSLEYNVPNYNLDIIRFKYYGIVENNLINPYTSIESDVYEFRLIDVYFEASVIQRNLLPEYSNIIEINVQIPDIQKAPVLYDVIIDTSTGKHYEFTNIIKRDSSITFMFNNQFNTIFLPEDSTDIFPFIKDLLELCDATITITGYKGYKTHTVVLDYKYNRIPQTPNIQAVEVVYDKDDYKYNIQWLLDNNATEQYYRIFNRDNNELLEVKSNSFYNLRTDKHILRFGVESYCRSGESSEVFLYTPFIDIPEVRIIKGNTKVTIEIKPIDLATDYMLSLDGLPYMVSKEPVFDLIKFTGNKTISIRAVYNKDIYHIIGISHEELFEQVPIKYEYELNMSIFNKDIFRFQLKNDIIDERIKYINIYAITNKNEVIIIKTLDIPIDDFKFIQEIDRRKNPEYIGIFFQLVAEGWEYKNTPIKYMVEGIFRFEDISGNFGTQFL